MNRYAPKQLETNGRKGACARTSADGWRALPAEERLVVGQMLGMIRGLKLSRVPGVARAAKEWERGIEFFIKVRLMYARPRREIRSPKSEIRKKAELRNPKSEVGSAELPIGTGDEFPDGGFGI